MGMFDTLYVKKKLPLTKELKALDIKWDEVDFQTKDLENFLTVYEITKQGNLRHLNQERRWKDDDDAFLKGYFEVVKEEWVDIDFHGTINFYTNHSDNIKYHWDFTSDNPDQLSWDDIELIQGFDWWVEFEATFTKGKLQGIELVKVDKHPISERIKNNKIWAEKRAEENKKLYKRVVNFMRKFKWYRTFINGVLRGVNKLHSHTTKVLYKL